MLDKLTAPAEETAQETTEAWLAAFGAALTRGDARALLFGDDIAKRVGRGFDETMGELRNMWTRTPQPGLWFTAGAFSQARIYGRYIALQIDAIERGMLAKNIETRD